MSKRRFIIEVDGVYYMTIDPLLVYDKADTKGSKHKADGIEEVRKKFEEIKNSPHTWYYAVEVKDADFAAAYSSKQ